VKKLLSLTINTQGFKTIKRGKKTYRSFTSQKEHNTRKEKMDANYLLKKELQHLNINYENPNYSTEEDIRTEMEKIEADYKSHYNRKMPKNYKPLINGLITFSETMQEDIKKYGVENMTAAMLDFLKEEYGNVCSLDLHMDETTPHFHFQVINYNYKEHKTHSAVLEKSLRDENNPTRINYAQDRLAKYLQSHIKEFDYQRGEIRSIKEYHNRRKGQIEHLKKLEEKTQEQEQELIQLRKNAKNAHNELSQLKDKYSKLNAEYLGLEAKYSSMKQQLTDEYNDAIEEILNDLEEFGKEKDAIKFLGLVVRYAKGEQAEKLHKLIKKYGKKIKGVDRRKNNRNSM